MSGTLLIINDPPYGTERAYNALRLARALVGKDEQAVRIFLIGDAVSCARSGQQVPHGYYNVGCCVQDASFDAHRLVWPANWTAADRSLKRGHEEDRCVRFGDLERHGGTAARFLLGERVCQRPVLVARRQTNFVPVAGRPHLSKFEEPIDRHAATPRTLGGEDADRLASGIGGGDVASSCGRHRERVLDGRSLIVDPARDEGTVSAVRARSQAARSMTGQSFGLTEAGSSSRR